MQASQTDALILASSSPRRAQLLEQLGVSFVVSPSDVDETRGQNESPRQYVRRVAADKATVAARKHAGQLVIAADTSVVLGATVLGKPTDACQAKAMLEQLAGTRHRVMTAVAVTDGRRLELCVNVTTVHFRAVQASEIAAYVGSDEPYDKAGGYGIQGRAGAFVERIDGSYSSVMGLPLSDTTILLRAFGVYAERFW